MSETLKQLFSNGEISDALDNLAHQINTVYNGQPLHLVGVLCGAAPFMCELAMRLTMPVTMDFVRVQSYQGTESAELQDLMGLSMPITGRNVMIVEDIVDTGCTLEHLVKLLRAEEPLTLTTCVLFDKPSRRKVKFEPDYCGFSIPNVFIVGYGLDYEQRYRNLPYVAELSFED